MNRKHLIGVLLLASACDGAARADAGMDTPPRDAPPVDAWFPPIPADPIEAGNALTASDPLYEGQQRFLYDTFGTEVLGSWPPAGFMIDLMTAEPDVFGDQYASFGFVADDDRELPYGFVRGIEDDGEVHETCALCHVGRLPDGTLWIGMPNRELDFARFRYEVSARWEAAGNPPLIDALEASKAHAYGPGRTSAETSGYPDAVPADFPPYFSLGERTSMNYLGTGGNVRTEVFLSVFTFGAGAPNAEEARVPFPSPARLDPMIEFMGSLRAPPPPVGDATMIAAGRVVFERERCGDCHHVDDVSLDGVVTYDTASDGTERLPGDDAEFPRGSIRTSYLHRILIDGLPDPATDGSVDEDAGSGGDEGRVDLIEFILANRLRVSTSDGYRASLLHGLWATAPYLHNGSVPTLEDLLRPPAERPTTFMRGDFEVDTTTPGNANEGHTFGTTISDPDRAALVAYLNSL